MRESALGIGRERDERAPPLAASGPPAPLSQSPRAPVAERAAAPATCPIVEFIRNAVLSEGSGVVDRPGLGGVRAARESSLAFSPLAARTG